MTAAKALTWDQHSYYIPTRITGQTVVSSSRRLPVVRTETRGKITYLHFNISTNDQTMVKAWPAHVIERINPMPDDTNDTNEDTAQDAINGETQPVEVEHEGDNQEAGLGVALNKGIVADPFTILEAERQRQGHEARNEALAQGQHDSTETAPGTPDAAPADDAPAAGEDGTAKPAPRIETTLVFFDPTLFAGSVHMSTFLNGGWRVVYESHHESAIDRKNYHVVRFERPVKESE